MRTKTLLLTAALGVASIASSMAQAVYSVNVVGYVNLTLQPGFSLIANQLKASPNNQLNSVLPSAPLDSQIQKFNPATLNYDTYFWDNVSAWINEDGSPATATMAPGEGAFFFNAGSGPTTLTFVGEVQLGVSTVTIPPGFRAFGSPVPQQVELSAANGFSLFQDMEFHLYTGVGPDFYKKRIYDAGLGWLDFDTGVSSPAILAVGQGALIFNPDALNHDWVRNFTIP